MATVYSQKFLEFNIYSFYNSVGDVDLDGMKKMLADNKQVKMDFIEISKT